MIKRFYLYNTINNIKDIKIRDIEKKKILKIKQLFIISAYVN